MKVQRLFCYSLIVLLLLCSNKAWAKTQLILWHSWIENNSLWEKIKKDFNAENTGIELIINGFAHEEMKEAIILSGFQRKSADIVLMPSDWLGYHNVMQFSAVPQKLLSPKISSDVIKQTTFNKEILGIPLFQGNHLLFMYNKLLVDKPVTTWQALIKAQQSFEKMGVKTLAVNYNEMFWFVPFIDAFGRFPVEQDNITINTPSTVAALKYYKHLAEVGVIDKECSYQCVSTDFYQGKFAYAMAGSWAYKLAKQALGDNLGLAEFPTLNGREFKSMKGNLVIAFPKKSLLGLKRSALIKFSQFIQQEKYQQLMFEESSLFPVNAQLMNKVLTNASNDFIFSFQQFNRSTSLPVSTSVPAVWNGMYKGFMLYMNDELSADDAAVYMQKSVEREQIMLSRERS